MRDMNLGQSALLRIGTFQGFCFCMEGLRAQVVVTMSWSLRPGLQST